ncbi:MAG: discoidin domain-containing protein, partial [Armatimonadetes bacterium]|nr:discoidin domain-containing protein [Armatimonadota bacterium]
MRQSALLVATLPLLSPLCPAQPAPGNLALNKPYTLSPAPNYALCLDPGDATQLTDGVYVEGHFWTREGTVGWSGGGLRFITIDLGQVCPISGLSFNTAAGVAEVYWPKSLLILVSDDGQAWHSVGDLMEMLDPGFLPEYGTYAIKKLGTESLETHGRYVELVVQPDRNYAFVDEIEVHRGPDALLAKALPGKAVANVADQMKVEAFGKLVRTQLRRDLQAAREDIAAPGLADAQRTALTGKADQLAVEIADMPPIEPEGFRAVLPMTDLERAVFALQAEVWRAQ